jgi:hypothetical protein
MQRVGRLYGVKKTLLAVTTVVLVAGCGGHDKNAAAPSKSGKPAAPAPAKTSCDPADDSCIPPDNASSSPIAVPALEVGKSTALQLPTPDGVANAEITLTGLKTKPRTSVDPKGTQELCFGFKLKNTGTRKLDGAGISWKWFGLDGEQADTDAGTAGVCDELGHQFAGGDQPDPLPGKYVTGYYSMAVPTKPGALEVTDSDDSPLFRLNYGPRSAQAPIDARGQ